MPYTTISGEPKLLTFDQNRIQSAELGTNSFGDSQITVTIASGLKHVVQYNDMTQDLWNHFNQITDVDAETFGERDHLERKNQRIEKLNFELKVVE